MFAMTVVVFDSTKKNISISANAKHTVQVAPKAFKVDNGSSQYIYANKVKAAYPMFLFGNNRNGKFSEGVAMKLYSFKVYENDVLIADYIPCRNDNTTGLYVGAIGLWDDVNNLFYPNTGTGTFIAGELPKRTHKTLVNGTLYDVTGGKCLVNGTVYSVKKGRTLIGGTGYDITFEEAIGKTWTFDTSKAPTSMFPNLSAGSTQTFSVSFTSNGQQYIGFRFSHYYMGDNLGYVTSSGGITVYDMEEGWTSAYATITFDEAPSGDLLTWLQENAVQQ